MDWKQILGGFVLGAFAKWLHGALTLPPKTAQQADKILGGKPGTAQGVLNDVERVVDSAAANAVDKAATGGRPGGNAGN